MPTEKGTCQTYLYDYLHHHIVIRCSKEVQILILVIAGYSGSGKTKLVTMLLERLSREGISAATIKHARSPLLQPGKDTTRHLASGAMASVGIGTDGSVIYLGEGMDLEVAISLLNRIVQPEVTIAEGFKDSRYPKVVLGDAEAREPVVMRGESPEEVLEELVSLIWREISIERTLADLPGLDCGKCGYGSCRALAEAVVEERVSVEACRNLPDSGVTVIVNGERVAMGDFASTIVGNTITSMVCSLKGVKDPYRIEIVVERGRRGMP